MREKSNTGMLRLIRDPKAVVGVVISIAGTYWAFKDFHFLNFKESILKVDLIYLGILQTYCFCKTFLKGFDF